MQRLLVAFLTIAIFAAGFGARMWTEKAPAVPAPPLTAGIEFNPKGSEAPRGGPPRMSRTEMIATIERNKRQIEVYRNRVEELDREFDKAFVEILNDQQRVAYKEEQRKQNDFFSRLQASAGSKELLTDEQIDFARNNPLSNVLRMIQPRERAQRLERLYDLTPEQRAKVLTALNVRRDGFIKLLEETPAPSVRYSDLATMVQRIADPATIEQEKRERQERQEKNKKAEAGK